MAIPLLERLGGHGERTAIMDVTGAYGYARLQKESAAIASALLDSVEDLRGARVAILANPGRFFVAALCGVWKAGGIAVPLCVTHPLPEIRYVLSDSGATRLLADKANAASVQNASMDVWHLENLVAMRERPLPDLGGHRRALMLYTSGTTGRPKGVVTTHSNIEAMILPMIDAWGWQCRDRILHVLPLHHAHGLINALLCCLWAGATCEMLPAFAASAVWGRFGRVTLFMGVPTMYHKLVCAWRAAPPDLQERWSLAAANMRLMVSGSAALPRVLFREWESITRQRLLERYGMTETGMVLSNPLEGARREGTVGQPLPGISVRVVSSAGHIVTGQGAPGELHVKGPGVFLEYWGRPEETREAFCGRWFRTGDIAVVELGYYRILGRRSLDIIKTGGFKVSALEIEEVLRTHASVDDCAVLGIRDEAWGERVCAAVTVRTGRTLTEAALRAWAKTQMAAYKVPSAVAVVVELPRNAMGKVFKPALREFFEADQERPDSRSSSMMSS